MSWNYYFIMWGKEENKSFNALVNGTKEYSHDYGNELVFANAKKLSYGAIARKFQNDK